MNPDKIPDLNWKLINTYHTTNIGQVKFQATDISTQCVAVDSISYVEGNKCGEWYGITLNTDTITLQSNIKLLSLLSHLIVIRYKVLSII